MIPMRTLDTFRLSATVLVLAVFAPPVAGGDGERVPAPAWFTEHNEFLAGGSGVFHADNSAYRSEDEPWEAYGLAWEKGPSSQTLGGRLFVVQDGHDAGTIWEFFVFWHPVEGKAMIYQIGTDGSLGLGTMDPPAEDGTQRMEQTFFDVGGGTRRIAHVSRNSGDIHDARSFQWIDGEWKPRRAYVWHRIRPDGEEASGD